MVEKEARLHHKTVTEVSEGKHTPKKKRAPSQRAVVNKIKVDMRVLKVAKQLAKNDLRRLKIVDATTVIVRNPLPKDHR